LYVFYFSYIYYHIYNLIAATKEKLCKRIAKWEVKGVPSEKYRVLVEKFLGQAITPPNGQYPRLQQYYRDNFNGIDRWSIYKDALHYIPPIKELNFRLFVAAIELAVMQTWGLLMDFESNTSKDNIDDRLPAYAIDLSSKLNKIKF
jgi:hypothetical protein